MMLAENVSLAPLTTFKIGGPARFFKACLSEEDIVAALAENSERGLPLSVLGAGSNLLVPDEGIDGIVLHITIPGLTFTEEAGSVLAVAGAGVSWDELVTEAGKRELWGIENLAGIPGNVGGAPVQNIGAYGAEVSSVFAFADVIDARTSKKVRLLPEDAQFSYRDSRFKREPWLVVTRVGFHLSHVPSPNLSYKDLRAVEASGSSLSTPNEIAQAVRAIRAKKFPDLTKEGTAGSFFKNPIVPAAKAQELVLFFPELPTFPQKDGSVKISLAWLLDHALKLKGFAIGPVRLFENQPLVITASGSATAAQVDALANEIAARVKEISGVEIEREVETFGIRHA